MHQSRPVGRDRPLGWTRTSNLPAMPTALPIELRGGAVPYVRLHSASLRTGVALAPVVGGTELLASLRATGDARPGMGTLAGVRRSSPVTSRRHDEAPGRGIQGLRVLLGQRPLTETRKALQAPPVTSRTSPSGDLESRTATAPCARAPGVSPATPTHSSPAREYEENPKDSPRQTRVTSSLRTAMNSAPLQ